MPTVTLNKKVFEMLVGKELSDNKLKDRISMLGTDLESIDDKEIKVEIFPNRPDMLSEQGFARAFSSFIGVKTGLRKYNVKKFGEKVIVNTKSLPKEYPYAVACIVKGLKFDDEKVREIIQLQEKLGSTLTRNRKKGGLGLYPLEKIKFPISFEGKEFDEVKFRPLEFPRVISARQILSQHPKGKEYGHIMEGWNKCTVFTDANGTIMSMPPIINSHDVGKIDETTTEVFIEGTGPDLRIISISLAILATALSDMGGQIYSLEMVYPGKKKKFDFPDLSPKKWKISIKFINKWLGLDLKEKDIKKLLEKMGFGYQKGHVLVPAYRADIMHEVDFAEDIAIAYGYENFVEEIPNVSTIAEEDSFEIFKIKVAETLVGLDLLELNTYNLTSEETQNKLMKTNFNLIKMESAVSTEYDVVRAWILPSLLETLKNNKHHEYPQKIFDIGVVFKHDPNTETGVKEATRLALALCDDKADFTKIKQVFDYLMRMLDVKYVMKDTEHPSFIEGRVARVSVKGKDVAYIGEINPKVLTNFDLDIPVGAFELNLSDLFEVMN